MSDRSATIAICCYNGAQFLPNLLGALSQQTSPVPFEILVVDNNSTDDSESTVLSAAQQLSVPVRIVNESSQGIPYARNRAIEASRDSDYLVFIDVDETPAPGWLAAGIDALVNDGASCVGGKIHVEYGAAGRPAWLDSEIAAFLGALDHGEQALWIKDRTTPIWSGNVAYDRRVFDDGLRFDSRYNRAGDGVGGGSDGIMFRHLLERGTALRYRPDMEIIHHVDEWKLTRRYFVRLHYAAGIKSGRYEELPPGKSLFGIPGYLYRQWARQVTDAAVATALRRPGYVRKLMNCAHTTGTMVGRTQRTPDRKIETA